MNRALKDIHSLPWPLLESVSDVVRWDVPEQTLHGHNSEAPIEHHNTTIAAATHNANHRSFNTAANTINESGQDTLINLFLQSSLADAVDNNDKVVFTARGPKPFCSHRLLQDELVTAFSHLTENDFRRIIELILAESMNTAGVEDDEETFHDMPDDNNVESDSDESSVSSIQYNKVQIRKRKTHNAVTSHGLFDVNPR
jgi:hypothetical protein